MKPDDPAFPCTSNGVLMMPGMTVRLWLAGQATVGMLAFSPVESTRQYRSGQIAEEALEIADAILARDAKDREET